MALVCESNSKRAIARPQHPLCGANHSAMCAAALSVHLDDSKTEELMKELMQCVQSSQSSEAAQTCMQAVAACAKALGFRFGPYVAAVLPLVMERCRAASQQADGSTGAEEKEAALHTITAVVQYCAEVCVCPTCAWVSTTEGCA